MNYILSKIYNLNLIFIFLLLIIFILCSNKFWTFEESLSFGFTDMKSYVDIAKAGTNNSFTNFKNLDIPSHFSERWVPNYVIGFISNKLNLGLLNTYYIAIFLIILLISFIIYKSNFNKLNKLIYFIFIFFNPYTFRSFFSVGFSINDLLFIFSTILLVFSLHQYNHRRIIISILIGCIARQTVVMYIPIFIFAYFYNLINYKYLLFYITLTIISFFLMKIYSNILFENNPETTLKHIYGIFTWFFNNPKMIEFYLFISRMLIFFLILSPVLILNYNKNANTFFILSFLFLIIQPILAGPMLSGSNIARLFTFGLPFLGFPLLINNQNNKFSILFCIFMVLISFHHNYSVINNKLTYFVILFFISIISFYIKYKFNISQFIKNYNK